MAAVARAELAPRLVRRHRQALPALLRLHPPTGRDDAAAQGHRHDLRPLDPRAASSATATSCSSRPARTRPCRTSTTCRMPTPTTRPSAPSCSAPARCCASRPDGAAAAATAAATTAAAAPAAAVVLTGGPDAGGPAPAGARGEPRPSGREEPTEPGPHGRSRGTAARTSATRCTSATPARSRSCGSLREDDDSPLYPPAHWSEPRLTAAPIRRFLLQHPAVLLHYRRCVGRGRRRQGGEAPMSMMRTKSIEDSIAEGEEAEYKLKKTLSALDLTVFGIGVIIGAGIFTLTGRAAKEVAGPSIVLSFVLAALCCALAALCYAEFASSVPVSGSAYTFSYASLGEVIAWIIGWDLLLELLLGASVVAQGWSSYFGVFMGHLGIDDTGVGRLRLPLRPDGVRARGGADGARQHRHQGVDAGQPRARRRSSCSSCCSSSSPASGSSTGPTTARSSRRRSRRRPRARWSHRCCRPSSGSPPPTSACSASCRVPRWCSSPTSASTSSRPPPRRPRTRSATCRSASSARWSSAPCSTARSPWSSPG